MLGKLLKKTDEEDDFAKELGKVPDFMQEWSDPES